MRIAITIPRIDPQHGGAESWSLQFCRWLLAEGHQIRVIGLKVAADLPIPSEYVQQLEAPNRLSALQQLDGIYAREHFDIVHDMGLGLRFDIFQSHVGSRRAMQEASQTSRPVLARVASHLVSYFSGRKRHLGQISSAQFSSTSGWYIAVSQMAAEGLHKQEGIPLNRIHCVPNGIDTEQFQPVRNEAIRHEARQGFAIGKNELCLLTIAHNHRLKGVPHLVRAIRRLQDFQGKLHLLVVGGHRQSAKSVQLGKHTVTYAGSLPDAKPAYSAADVCVHPTFYDACSLTVLEAMSCGLPTITTRCNGAADRITHGVSGFILPSPLEMQHLSTYLCQLTCSEKRRQMGIAARQSATAWTIEDNFRAMAAVHNACFDEKSRQKQTSRTSPNLLCSNNLLRTA
ncbi:glycosyltransferase family 1 protein [Bremerella cremea]|uniref:Glycosyltransferase subfamily 4-like N-terminal domain-containing protein n=1 Tax=Blastopirellula marina TaxID=124 RepID=A0A2S8FCE2_9BACT|nr:MULTISPECIES: glycosyltransferase family 4 protein [Pirellulaceae]PQO29817.1 hypothetical protein C5Y83_27630 [Blastopirellula marina]RCS43119.1 glycosyltransferase family 1 protein [Bremerella cremea]